MSDDYISRSALRAVFNKTAEGVGLDTPWDITAIETLIEAAPAVDVEPVRYGRWIVRNRGEWVDCSECGTVGSPRWKRCPLCEAKMLPPEVEG